MSLVDDLSERRGSSAAKREAQCRSRADLRLAGHTARSRTHHCQPAKRLDGSAPISNFYFVWSSRRYATGRSEFALSLRIGQKIQTLSRTYSFALARRAGVCSRRCLEKFSRYLVHILGGAGSGCPLNSYVTPTLKISAL